MRILAMAALLLLWNSAYPQDACMQQCSIEKKRCRNAMHTSCAGVADMAGCVRSCAVGDVACSMDQLRCVQAEKASLKQCQRENERAMQDCQLESEQCNLMCAAPQPAPEVNVSSEDG